MKIQSLQKTIHYAVGVREKFDGQSSQKEGGQNPQFEQHQQDASQQEREAEVAHRKVSEPNEAKVNEAVESFQADILAQSNGLSASVIGNGPGLRVVLKDGSGAVVRQLSGAEFLKLRESGSKEDRTPGKILDQKF